MSCFKITDWIMLSGGRPWRATEFDIVHLNCDEDVELWQPKEGEWCWYNKKYFIKVKNIKGEQIYFSSLDRMYINDWDYLCKFEPFIGELPTFLKDNK